MQRQSISPANKQEWLKLRSRDVTSTEVSALFDCSPYVTRFELWHRKRDEVIVEIGENERMKWGTRLQDSIAQGIASDYGWAIQRADEYLTLPDERIGSSFDFFVVGSNGKPEAILEVKNVDSLQFKEGWLIDGDSIEAPPHIELQVQHQMLVSGISVAYIGALIGGNRIVLLERKADEEIHAEIRARTKDFWGSIAEGREPTPDFDRDAEAVIRLHQFASPEKKVAADNVVTELALRYQKLGWLIKPLEEERMQVKAKILMAIGDAEKCVGNGFSISAGVIGPSHVSYDKEAYRNFRITWKKDK